MTDFTVQNEGSIFLLHPHSTEASNWIEEHIGAVSFVYHELVSDKLHIDLHVVEPSEKRNSYTLITSGMSDEPMAAPAGKDNYRFTELMLKYAEVSMTWVRILACWLMNRAHSLLAKYMKLMINFLTNWMTLKHQATIGGSRLKPLLVTTERFAGLTNQVLTCVPIAC